MSGLTSRMFHGHLVRFVIRADGPWFVGKDVCDILEIKNNSDSVRKMVPEKHRDKVAISDPMGRDQATTVPEALADCGIPAKGRELMSALGKVRRFVRRHNVPTGRDSRGRMTVPVEALRAALGLGQAQLNLGES